MSAPNPSPAPPTNAPQPSNSTFTSDSTSSTMPPKSLTLILAATPSLGIGQHGGLPWPQLRKEMGYFARVTKRVSPPTTNDEDAAGKTKPTQSNRRANAVVMGRKTWDSIPPKFRPLKGRVNVVVTRSVEGFRNQLPVETHDQGEDEGVEGPLVAGSVADALSQLQDKDAGTEIDKVMVIGGASIYEQALKLKEARHVLLTKIRDEYECDTFFSEDLEGRGWRKADTEELKEFTGEEFEEGTVVEEKGVKFEFCLYSRVD